jgi:hypothetical protein
MARGIPAFDSVWVDALMQEGRITPFQARQIHAGSGDQLLAGDCVIADQIGATGYAQLFRGQRVGDMHLVIVLAAPISSLRKAELEHDLETLVERSSRLTSDGVIPIQNAELSDDGEWLRAQAPDTHGETLSAGQWLVPHGRLPPDAVLEIARQMSATMAELDRHEVLHSDISTRTLWFTNDGNTLLLMPGARAIIHPEEGYAHADLPPDALDYVAPERIIDGTTTAVASELFACGALWWHLLAGRPPFPGGDTITKLRNIQRCRVPDIRTIAREADARLCEAITRCMRHDPTQRGDSFDKLATQLGKSTQRGRTALANCVRAHRHPKVQFRAARASHSSRWPIISATAATIAIGASVFLWSQHSAKTTQLPVANLNSQPNRAAEAPSEPPSTHNNATAPTDESSQVVVITADEARRGQLPFLRPGMTIRGAKGGEVIFNVAPNGVVIDVPHVRFENIHFRMDAQTREDPAMIAASSRWIEFAQCSFQTSFPPGSVSLGKRLPFAISCRDTQVVVEDCIFRSVASAIAPASGSDTRIDLNNCLFLGPGAIARLRGSSKRQASVSLELTNVTVREATCLLDYLHDAGSEGEPAISITAQNCVFAPQFGAGLFLVRSSRSPQQFLQRVALNGEGSLLDDDAEIAIWERHDGIAKPIDSAPFAIDGLIRTEVEFVGPQIRFPSSSELKTWTGPSRGDRPPGADVRRLRLPNDLD